MSRRSAVAVAAAATAHGKPAPRMAAEVEAAEEQWAQRRSPYFQRGQVGEGGSNLSLRGRGP